VQFYDADKNELGNHLIGCGEGGWQTHSFKLTEMNKKAMNQEDIGKIAKIVFSLYLPEGLAVAMGKEKSYTAISSDPADLKSFLKNL
jgi:hypothetical protein